MIIFTEHPVASADGERVSGSVENTHFLALGLSLREWRIVLVDGLSSESLSIKEAPSLRLLATPDIEIVVILSAGHRDLFDKSVRSLAFDIDEHDTVLAILLPWKPPPEGEQRADGTVSSFLCSASIFRSLLLLDPSVEARSACFWLLYRILNGALDADKVFVRQLPHPSAEIPRLDITATTIMAHRGPDKYLQTALAYCKRVMLPSHATIKVGLDVPALDEYCSTISAFADVHFYHVTPTPAGPYVVRQALIEKSSEDVLIFQDSDDLPCHDRFATQYAEMLKGKADLVGCHELRVDEVNQRVEALRYPLNVSAALNVKSAAAMSYKGHEPLLHATAIMARDRFMEAGGFSTDHKIANDTQFMLRAFFTMAMRNVDAFLYIRRLHHAALTVATDTALGTPLRQALNATWKADFEAVKSGRVELYSTSLRPRTSSTSYKLERVAS